MDSVKMNEALDFLRAKYGAANGTIDIVDGSPVVREGDTVKILLPHRVERRFVELKKIATDGTLEDVSTLRFAAFANRGADMRAMLAREFDIAVFITGSSVKRVFATAADGLAINVLAKLENGVNVSVEIGAGLPAGDEPYDRHEIIARRGVASDQTIDTHTPHCSIRCFGEDGTRDFTDVDTELFGLSTTEIWIVRAAFKLLQTQEIANEWNAAAVKAAEAAEAAFKSDISKKPIDC